MVLFIVVYPYNTYSFFTSGYKFESHFRKLNLRKELNLSQISPEVDETFQSYLACLNKQKSQGDLLLSAIVLQTQIPQDEGM